MPSNKEELELAFKVEMETREALKAVSGIDKALKGVITRTQKIKGFDSKSIREFRKEAAKTAKDFDDIVKSMGPKSRGKLDREFKAVEQSYKDLLKVTRQERQKILKLERTLDKAKTKDDIEKAKEELDLAKKTGGKLIRESKRRFSGSRHGLSKKMLATGVTSDMEKRSASAKQAKEFVEGIKSTKVGKELADGFTDAISAVKGKDIFGLGKAGFKASSTLLKGAAKFFMAKGAGVQAKGEAMGGGMGKALGGLGKAMQGLGPLLGTLSKIAPILGMAGGAIVGLVKLLLDVDASMKEINKDVLEGVSTWDMYASQGKSVALGMAKLDDTLASVQDQVTNFKMNWKMGTAAKDHTAVLNVLGREGISLKNIEDRLENNKNSSDALTKSMQKYTDITSMAIGYSRLFGVSVDEIAQFQSEMMRDLGSSLTDMSVEFNKIGDAANSSGIAANKFFAILRGVSSDLSLYGVRIGEVTKMLGQLGKVMSPRTADKFLKAFAQGLTGKSIQDRLKLVLMGGEGAVKDIQADIQRQKKDLIEKVAKEAGVSAEDAKTLLEGGRTGAGTLTELGASGKVKDVGTLREAYKNAIRNEKSAKLGTYGAAAAAKNMSGYGAYALQKKAVLRGSGSKDIESAVGLKGEEWGAMAAGGAEQLEALRGMERGLSQQKEDLVNAIDNPAANKDLISELKEMGYIAQNASNEDIKNNALLLKKTVSGMKEEDVWKSLDKKNAEEQKTDSQKMLEAAKEQGTRTKGIMDRMDAIWDALFNWIYKAMMGLWDTLVDMWASLPSSLGGSSGEAYKKGRALEKAAMESKNSDVREALEKSGGDQYKFRGELMKTAGAASVKGRDELVSQIEALTKEKESAKTPEEKEGIAAKVSQLTKLLEKDWTTMNTKVYQEDQIRALESMGGKFADVAKFMTEKKATGESYSTEGAFQALGTNITSKDMGDLTNAMLHQTDPQVLAKILPSLESYKRGVGANSPAPAQQQATAAAANLGQGGGAVVSQGGSGASGSWDNVPAASGAGSTSSIPGGGPAATPISGYGAWGELSKATPSTPGGGPNSLPTLPDEKAMNEAVLSQVDFTGGAVVNSLQDLWNALRMKGIKLDKPQLENEIKGVIQDGTYLGSQKSLAEYALYTSSDPGGVMKKMKDSGFKGMDSLANSLESQMEGAKQARLAGHAAGGVVTGISDGMAQINPAPGEGLASIGKGERILPAGAGGGGSVTLNVNGIGGSDLANFLKDKVAQGIYEYKRREKFT